MTRRLFLPTARQTNWLLIIGFVSVGYGFYLRHLGLEHPLTVEACHSGARSWLCLAREAVRPLIHYAVFGVVALVAAIVNLIRPSIILFAIAIAFGGLGLVLYNAGSSALAVALLLVSFARPDNAAERS